jgi:hypothetical protein
MKLSEEEFWKRYFQSRLFNAHRASIRSSAAQHVVKDDPILDKYLEKDDDGMFRLVGICAWLWFLYICAGLEPRRQRNDGVDLFVDLNATKEDHEEVALPEQPKRIALTQFLDWKREGYYNATGKAARCSATNTKIQ